MNHKLNCDIIFCSWGLESDLTDIVHSYAEEAVNGSRRYCTQGYQLTLQNRKTEHPFCGARYSINILFQKQISHYTQRPLYCAVGHLKNTPVSTEKRAPPFRQSFWFGSNPNKIITLQRSRFFFFILVHTQVRHVRNQYIIICTMQNDHFTRT